jgi:NTE family protein
MRRFSFSLLIAVLLSILNVLPAQAYQAAPPKVTLVLSGGGARGAAHIGVLKVLEREKIPIDSIVGTSFGALVGGLYSLGYSADEIEKMFLDGSWVSVFSNSSEPSPSRLTGSGGERYLGELNFKKFAPELPSGLLAGQRLTELLGRLTTEPIVSAGFDFDRLAYRFRAVCTNLVNGERYVFKSGAMSEALRASISVPLLFTPVEKDGMLLVDGGLVDNLPTDVAREMGSGIVIAVDVTSPLLEKEQIKTLLQVIDQSVTLMMRHNVEDNRKLADLVLTPELEKYPGTEYDKMPEVIELGAKAAERNLEKIRALVHGVPYHGPGTIPSAPLAPVILSVSFEGLKEIPISQVHSEIGVLPGQKLDVAMIEKDLKRLYAEGLFERVDFKLVPAGTGSFHLVYVVKETSMRTLGASIRYDRTDGFVALAELRARQLFHTPSTLTLSTQFGGLENYVASLHYVPSYRRAMFYIAPEGHYTQREYPEYVNHELFDRFTYKKVGGQLTIGTSFKRSEVEIGYRIDRASIGGGTPPFTQAEGKVLSGLRLNLSRNTTDGRRFPERGTLLAARADARPKGLGGDLGYTKAEMDIVHFSPFRKRTNIQMFGSAGISRGSVPFYERYYVGGFSFSEEGPRRLIGFNFAELSARQVVIAGGAYRYRWIEQPIGFLKSAFISGIYNAAFIAQADRKPYRFDHFQGVGAELALETVVGPIRIAGGWGQGGRFNLYISIGPSF